MHEIRYICENPRISRILAILLLGGENLGKLARIARISRDSYRGQANCANLARFAGIMQVLIGGAVMCEIGVDCANFA